MSDKQNLWIVVSGLMGFLGVALGAFGAHGLESHLSVKMMETYRTGVLYHLIHNLALLSLAFFGNYRFIPVCWFFLFGIILFSFSLYAYSIFQIRFFAILTPFGGICFLIGWALIVYYALK
ncbi:MAG: DUF423 domain-containing protein [Clostridiales bacterium]